jgi:hypothetical protein
MVQVSGGRGGKASVASLVCYRRGLRPPAALPAAAREGKGPASPGVTTTPSCPAHQ